MVGSTSSPFWPHSYTVRSRKIHNMSEKFRETFAHIGTHCHELGHSFFGLSDQYEGTVDPEKYDLMSYGSDNGPNRLGECPAPISAIYKYTKEFYSQLYEIPLGMTNYEIHYGSANSNILYKVSIPNSQEYFILECRRAEGFNAYTPSYYYNDDLGVYIWHAKPGSMSSSYGDEVEIEYADNSNSDVNNTFPLVSTESQSFTNLSMPNSRKRDGTYSNVAFQNIRIIGSEPNTAYCKLDVLDETPQTPPHFAGAAVNNHPKLTWSACSEPDVYIGGHIKVFRGYQDGSGTYYMLAATIAGNSTSWIDADVTLVNPKLTHTTYLYKVSAVDIGLNESVASIPVQYSGSGIMWKISDSVSSDESIVKEYKLYQNYPNPFNPSTEINYQIPAKGFVTLKVYDVLGNEVATLVNEWQEPGSYNTQFTTSGKQLASGMSAKGGYASGFYFYTLTAGKFTDTKKLMLLK